jgi:hypothetical protein
MGNTSRVGFVYLIFAAALHPPERIPVVTAASVDSTLWPDRTLWTGWCSNGLIHDPFPDPIVVLVLPCLVVSAAQTPCPSAEIIL